MKKGKISPQFCGITYIYLYHTCIFYHTKPSYALVSLFRIIFILQTYSLSFVAKRYCSLSDFEVSCFSVTFLDTTFLCSHVLPQSLIWVALTGIFSKHLHSRYGYSKSGSNCYDKVSQVCPKNMLYCIGFVEMVYVRSWSN